MVWRCIFTVVVAGVMVTVAMNATEKASLREKVLEMFKHAYNSYMTYAYPADELMPLSCQGRYRGSHKSRGDIDDALGNFSLTLIDSLDTLAVLGELDEFENGVKRVINDVTFDRDVVVSVFETNIRIVGGLLGGHVMSRHLQSTRAPFMAWYEDELLNMATDVARRLLPAFNTTTGIPYPRINLKYGLTAGVSRVGKEHDTCTACAGTIILEFAALSRLTGDPTFEEKAKKAMAYLWKQRHRVSDLVGTVINIHNGDWVRRDSGVGAGIDSYYEYLLKAYILLGDSTYYDRFTKHYEAVMKYMNQGPMLVDVHMHRPTSTSRHFMDSLQAFWPGLQVLHGDLKPAIEHHEMLYQLVQRHNFLPEAFTTDFRIHWAHHPLRPEFLESTYFLYKATGDEHYLDVGRTVLENLDQHGRVKCGFAAIKDVTTGQHDDQMDSYVLAETFKYLWLLFSNESDLLIDVDDYIFTTEAHLLPLTLSMHNCTKRDAKPLNAVPESTRSCPSNVHLFPDQLQFASTIRQSLKDYVASICPKQNSKEPVLRARDFVAGNSEQLHQLRRMGIRIVTMHDGRVQLLHTASEAATTADAEEGMVFMQEMIELSKQQQQQQDDIPVYAQIIAHSLYSGLALIGAPAKFGLRLTPGLLVRPVSRSEVKVIGDEGRELLTLIGMLPSGEGRTGVVTQDPVHVQLLSLPYFGSVTLAGGPAQFGLDLIENNGPARLARVSFVNLSLEHVAVKWLPRGDIEVKGHVVIGQPYDGCSEFTNAGDDLVGAIVVVQRGGCLFVDKARHIQNALGLGGVVIDNNADTSMESSMIFSMSGDGKQDVTIPMVFLFAKEGSTLIHALDTRSSALEVALTSSPMSQEVVMKEIMERQRQLKEDHDSAGRLFVGPETPIVTDKSVTSSSFDSQSETGTSPVDSQSHVGPQADNQSTTDSSRPRRVEGPMKMQAPSAQQEPSTTIDVDGIQIKIRGQHRTKIPENTPGVESFSTGELENKLRLDIDRLFEGRSRKDLQYEEVSHKILNLLSETLVEFGREENEDYLNAVKTMVEAAVQTMDIGINAVDDSTLETTKTSTHGNGDAEVVPEYVDVHVDQGEPRTIESVDPGAERQYFDISSKTYFSQSSDKTRHSENTRQEPTEENNSPQPKDEL